MIQDGVTAGPLPKRPLETRLAAVIETATSTFFEALDGEVRATAQLHVQKAAQAADEAWPQTVDGHNGPVVTNPTVSELEHPSSASQYDDGDDMDFSLNPRKRRLSAPQLQAQLSRLSDRTRLRRLKNTHTHSAPRVRGSKWREHKYCATRISLTNGSATWTRVRDCPKAAR